MHRHSSSDKEAAFDRSENAWVILDESMGTERCGTMERDPVDVIGSFWAP